MFPSQIGHDPIECRDAGHMRDGVNPTMPTTREWSRPRPRPTPFRVHQEETNTNTNIGVINVRKFVHREIERQRRQEMANLCGSLRTLLPPQYIKGKRSMPDLTQEAANYIKDMQKNIQQLKTRRDKLMSSKQANSDKNISIRDNYATVNPCPDGVEILINTNFEEGQGFPLSGILEELCQTGFDVVSCVSTRANQRSLHRIQSQATCTYSSDDLATLQERLSYMINCPPLSN